MLSVTKFLAADADMHICSLGIYRMRLHAAQLSFCWATNFPIVVQLVGVGLVWSRLTVFEVHLTMPSFLEAMAVRRCCVHVLSEISCSIDLWLAEKRSTIWCIKAEHLHNALHGIQTTLKRSSMDHTVLPAITPCLPLPRKRSPHGASTDWSGEHLIAAHYSFIDPERMKGWVGLVGWSSADG